MPKIFLPMYLIVRARIIVFMCTHLQKYNAKIDTLLLCLMWRQNVARIFCNGIVIFTILSASSFVFIWI